MLVLRRLVQEDSSTQEAEARGQTGSHSKAHSCFKNKTKQELGVVVHTWEEDLRPPWSLRCVPKPNQIKGPNPADLLNSGAPT